MGCSIVNHPAIGVPPFLETTTSVFFGVINHRHSHVANSRQRSRPHTGNNTNFGSPWPALVILLIAYGDMSQLFKRIVGNDFFPRRRSSWVAIALGQHGLVTSLGHVWPFCQGTHTCFASALELRKPSNIGAKLKSCPLHWAGWENIGWHAVDRIFQRNEAQASPGHL